MFKHALVIFALTLCFQARADVGPNIPEVTITVTVIDQNNNTSSDTWVFVGTEPDQPFTQNWALTDKNGQVAFITTADLADSPITLVRLGHPRITYFNQSGSNFRLKLPSPSRSEKVEASGSMLNWPKTQKGTTDFGLFFKLLSAEQLFSFQLSDIISPEIDSFSILGRDVTIPSNLVFPKQKHSYSIFPVTLDKPVFRLPVFAPDTYHWVALAGQFPFEKVAKALSDGGTIFDTLNDMSLQRFAVQKNQEVVHSTALVSIDSNGEKLSPCLKVQTQGFPKNYRVLALSLTTHQDTTPFNYQVMDLKTLDKSAQHMRCKQTGSDPFDIMSMALTYYMQGDIQIFEQSTSTIFARNLSPHNLPSQLSLNNYYAIPQINIKNNGSILSATRPEVDLSSPSAKALYAVFSDVNKTIINQTVVEEIHPQWVVFAAGQTDQFELPKLPQDLMNVKTKALIDLLWPKIRQNIVGTFNRWEVVWVGRQDSLQFDPSQLRSIDLGYDLFDNMTHASHNAFDF